MPDNTQYLKVLMSSPKTAKIIQDAWDAPIGSTKRAKAGAIIKSLRNTTLSHDGAGGPGNQYSLGGNSAFTSLDNYKSLNTASTDPNQTGIPTIPTVLPSAPQPVALSWKDTVNNMPALPGLIVKGASAVAATPSLAKSALQNTMGTEYGMARNAASWLDNHIFNGANSQQPYMPVTQQNPFFAWAQANKDRASAIFPWMTGGGNTAPGPTGPLGPTTGAQGSGNTGKTGGTSADGSETPPGGNVLGNDGGDPSMLPWQNLALTIQQALATGQPASSIAYSIMGNRTLLKQLFPNIPEDQLPAATSQETVKELEERLKESMGLNDLMHKKMNLVNAGHYLVSDLHDYIQGRDEYVKKVDSMIDGVKQKALTNGLSTDPDSQRSNESYLNMLYLLKGQQNKRYFDLVEAAKGEYNADVASLDNEVQYKSSEYSSRLAEDTPIAQEEYNQMLSAVTSYIQSYSTAIANGGDPWAQTSVAAAAATAIGAIDGTKPTDYSKTFPELSHIFSTDGGKTLNPVGLPTRISETITQDHYAPKDVYRYLQSMINATAAGDANTSPSDTIGKLSQMKDAMISLKDAGGDQIFGVQGVVDALNKGVVDAAKYPFQQYISSNFDAVRTAVDNLTSDVRSPSDTASVNAWKNDAVHNLNLNKTFVDALFNAYMSGFRDLRAGQNPNYVFDLQGRNINKVAQSDAEDTILGGVMSAWGAEINNTGYQYSGGESSNNYTPDTANSTSGSTSSTSGSGFNSNYNFKTPTSFKNLGL